MGIGNFYIHYHYQNYLRFGIEESEGQSYSSSQVYDFHGKKKEFLHNLKKSQSINKSLIEKYQNMYKRILNPNLKGQTTNIQNARKALDNMLIQKYQTQLANYSYVTDTGKGSLSPSQQLHLEINKVLGIRNDTLNKLRLSQQHARHQAKKVRDSVQNVYEQAIGFIQEAQKHGLKVTDIQKAVTQLEASLNQLSPSQNINFSSISSNGGSVDSVLRTCFPDGKLVDNQNIFTQVNDLIDLLKTPTAAAITGDIGEYTAALTWLIATKNVVLTEEKLLQEVGKLLEGSESEKISSTQSTQSLASYFNVNQDALSLYISENSTGDGNSVNKIDVRFTGLKEDIGVSVKNYNLSGSNYINLVSETPFSNILLEMPEFAAHYLNISSVHDYKLATHGEKIKGGQSFSQYRKQANDALKLYVLQSAMGGYTGRNQAQYILINDNSKSTTDSVKLIHINDIIQEIANRDISHMVSIKVNGKNINELSKKALWQNQWAAPENIPNKEGAKARMAKLLAEVHSSKIKVSVAPDVFSKLMYGVSRYQ